MKYDPVKRVLGSFFNRSPWLRKLFYRLLDLLLLRSWHIRKELKTWAKQHHGPAHILDAGSGFGQYDYVLSRMNSQWEITGIDVKTEQVEDCNRFFQNIGRHSVSFRVDDLTSYREENQYHLILSVDVMEHIEDDVQVFRNFHSSLRQGGMLLISTPSDQGGSDVHEHDDSSFIDEHVRDGYGVEEIREKLRAAGFQKTEVRYSYGKPGQVSWRLSMKYPIQLLNISRLFFVVLPFYYLLTFPVSWVLNYRDVHKSHSTGTGLIVKAWKTSNS